MSDVNLNESNGRTGWVSNYIKNEDAKTNSAVSNVTIDFEMKNYTIIL